MFVNNLANAFENLFNGSRSFDIAEFAILFVEVNDRGCFVVVSVKAFFDCFKVVVSTTAGLATIDKTGDEFFVVNLKVDHFGNIGATFRQHLFESLGLCDGAWESVEDDAFRILLFVHGFGEHVNNEVIRDEFTRFNVAFCRFAEFGSVFHFGTQNVARGDVGKAIFVDDVVALSSFSGSWRAKEYQVVHFVIISEWLVIYRKDNENQSTHL